MVEIDLIHVVLIISRPDSIVTPPSNTNVLPLVA